MLPVFVQLLCFISLQYTAGEMCECAQVTPLYPNQGWMNLSGEQEAVGVLGYNLEMSPDSFSHTLTFPGAVSGVALCLSEPCGCCLLCCWPGGGSEHPGTAEK